MRQLHAQHYEADLRVGNDPGPKKVPAQARCRPSKRACESSYLDYQGRSWGANTALGVPHESLQAHPYLANPIDASDRLHAGKRGAAVEL